MPHRIFLVEDLVILITKELVQCPHSEWDAVSLALTCRALESPALSVLWARQTALSTLIRVLPPNTLAHTTRDPYEILAGVYPKEEIVCTSNALSHPSHFVSNFALGYREGSFERELGQVAAIWILDACTLPQRTRS